MTAVKLILEPISESGFVDSSRQFAAVGSYVRLRLARLASVKHGRPGFNWTTTCNYAWSKRLGVQWFAGTVRYGAAHATRSRPAG